MATGLLKTEHLLETEGSGDCFEKIYTYKFQANEKFIKGWRKVWVVIPKDKQYESLLKAEVFFYSREVEPVDLIGYKKWLHDNRKEIQDLDGLLLSNRTEQNVPDIGTDDPHHLENRTRKCKSDLDTDIKCTDTVESRSRKSVKDPDNDINHADLVENKTKKSVNDLESDIKNDIKDIDSVQDKSDIYVQNNGEKQDTNPKHPDNFLELIEMIQNGLKLPDTEDLNIEPLNIDPTPSDIQRPKKPWEVS